MTQYIAVELHSPESVKRALMLALEAIDELDVPDDLRVPAFTKAVELLGQKALAEAAQVEIPASFAGLLRQ